MQRLAILIAASLALQTTSADTLTVAVASNFRSTAEIIVARFSTATGHELRISSGSTGKLHAQLLHGAPFDVFLAADEESPRLIEESGIGVSGSRFTYAIGTLVLWSGQQGELNCAAALDSLGDARLAIANPASAPYGKAAKKFLVTAGYWDQVLPNLVYGENIAQTMHFAVTGNAQYALVARSQTIDPRLPPASCEWSVPLESYDPIEQQVILLQRAADNAAALSFIQYLQSAEVRDTIRASGYGVP